jgi:hypothetical protein
MKIKELENRLSHLSEADGARLRANVSVYIPLWL